MKCSVIKFINYRVLNLTILWIYGCDKNPLSVSYVENVLHKNRHSEVKMRKELLFKAGSKKKIMGAHKCQVSSFITFVSSRVAGNLLHISFLIVDVARIMSFAISINIVILDGIYDFNETSINFICHMYNPFIRNIQGMKISVLIFTFIQLYTTTKFFYGLYSS